MSDQNGVWEMEATKGGDFENQETCPAGNFPANIVGLFDIGHQTEVNDKNETYEVRQLVLVLELQKKTSKGANFFKEKKFTWSMRDNSNWYKLVSAMTGKKFAEGEKFDPRKLLGMPCMANVTHSEVTKKGKTNTYANLETISQFPEGFPAPTQYRPPVSYSVMENKPCPDVSWVPNVYGKSLEKLISESKEYKQGKIPDPGPQMVDAIVSNIQSTPVAAAVDDIPF